jgi:hypothetical protein
VDPAVVHRILGDQIELTRSDPDIAQPGRQAEACDQPGDDIGRRLAGSPGRPRTSLTRACCSLFTGWLNRKT